MNSSAGPHSTPQHSLRLNLVYKASRAQRRFQVTRTLGVPKMTSRKRMSMGIMEILRARPGILCVSLGLRQLMIWRISALY